MHIDPLYCTASCFLYEMMSTIVLKCLHVFMCFAESLGRSRIVAIQLRVIYFVQLNE